MRQVLSPGYSSLNKMMHKVSRQSGSRKDAKDEKQVLRPSLRYTKVTDKSHIMHAETFLRIFLDKRTRLISIKNVVAAIRGLGLQKETGSLQNILTEYPTLNPGHLTEEEFVKIVEQIELGARDKIKAMGSAKGSDFYVNVFRYLQGGNQTLSAQRLAVISEKVGIPLKQEQAELMIKAFAAGDQEVTRQQFVKMMMLDTSARRTNRAKKAALLVLNRANKGATPPPPPPKAASTSRGKK